MALTTFYVDHGLPRPTQKGTKTMNAAALTAFLDVISKRLQQELDETNHAQAVKDAVSLIISTCADAAEITSAAILPQERGPSTQTPPPADPKTEPSAPDPDPPLLD